MFPIRVRRVQLESYNIDSIKFFNKSSTADSHWKNSRWVITITNYFNTLGNALSKYIQAKISEYV